MQGLNRILSPIKRNLKLMISRAVVSIVTDGLARQNLQLRLQSDEVADDVERFQNYGFSSFPKAGEAIVVSVGGKRSHLVAIVVDDKGVRPTALKSGDTVVYHAEGHQLLLTENGEAILTCKKFTVNAEQSVLFETPQTHFSGDVDIVGTSTAADHISGGISGKNHDHEKGPGKPV
ncbi:phage baseplate assembly protein V [Testudinibacter sp. TR-2022]|uniref:phage baseplate assembly protein V n=1 Tax=Testudinibacter sp. TR-2022 TaxID=2585029 RepID=UPI00111BC9CC|nr:phage baseplate assembly protein V [Testudinibacter sp. TR-2022]TNH03167.1 phage baseplate assembly protein V [Pasteurellaceae bacterium Phil31]TNH07454.1 phage baseplate assembly protein V [Testudinibacter sp. TR-2022]TNH07518.1 phage baseplate assembly protein V [Testudinibacter sp. TR-2022]TNH13213.1 phage baseplate assembly protein V [Testudinibacter sp. TR-2022]TNH18455.1 phage baseplate assembly protein V [Testudinibacter sp. TR-2022]